MQYYILKDGKPVHATAAEWAEWFGHPEKRRIELTQVGPYEVQTLFLGVNHNYCRQGEPIFYETTVCGPEGVAEYWTCRCGTFGAAKQQHRETVESVRASQISDQPPNAPDRSAGDQDDSRA